MHLTRTCSRTGSYLASSALCALLALGAGGCDALDYDPPPTTSLVLSEQGAWAVETPVVLRFSEPIEPGSLRVNVWTTERDDEGNIPAGTDALVGGCTLAKGECGALTVSPIEEGGGVTGVELSFDHKDLAPPGTPRTVEVEAFCS